MGNTIKGAISRSFNSTQLASKCQMWMFIALYPPAADRAIVLHEEQFSQAIATLMGL